MEFKPEAFKPFALTADLAQAAVDRLGRGWRVMGVEPLAGGSKSVFAIALADAPDLILKTYGDEDTWRLQKEAHVAGLIGDRFPTPTPRWLATDETREVLPRRYALITRLDGAAMSTRYGAPEAAGLYRQMGAALRGLSAVTLPAFGYILGGDYLKAYDSNLGYMRAAFRVKFRDFAGQGGDSALIARLQARVEAAEDAMAGCSQAVLCHNDIHPGNFLVGEDEVGDWRVRGLIDWENATAADPLFDLAKALDQVGHDDLPGRAPLAEGYGPLERPGAAEAVFAYRIYHKLEMRNWLVAKGVAPETGPAPLLADLEAMAG